MTGGGGRSILKSDAIAANVRGAVMTALFGGGGGRGLPVAGGSSRATNDGSKTVCGFTAQTMRGKAAVTVRSSSGFLTLR